MDKKQLRADIETKLTAALADFSKDISDKKFKKHIKKAAKLLGDGLKSTDKKPASVKKEAPAKKETVKAETAPAKATIVKPAVKKAKAAPKKVAKKAPKAAAKAVAPEAN